MHARSGRSFPDKTIWLYTGYRWEEITDGCRSLMQIDVLVDGRFVRGAGRSRSFTGAAVPTSA